MLAIQPGSRLVMIGDSITDAGRTQPLGEGLFDPFGKGYVSMVQAMVQAMYPQLAIRITNVGVSGNTVRELKHRWKKDVIDLQPDWLSVMIGINDVWRHFDLPLQPEAHVSIEEYEETLQDLVGRIRPRLKGLVLITPYFIEPDRGDAMRRMMDDYGAIVKRLSVRHEAVFVDTQAAFDQVLRHMHPMNLAWDRVHPNQAGHMIIARAFLDAIGFEWHSPPAGAGS